MSRRAVRLRASGGAPRLRDRSHGRTIPAAALPRPRPDASCGTPSFQPLHICAPAPHCPSSNGLASSRKRVAAAGLHLEASAAASARCVLTLRETGSCFSPRKRMLFGKPGGARHGFDAGREATMKTRAHRAVARSARAACAARKADIGTGHASRPRLSPQSRPAKQSCLKMALICPSGNRECPAHIPASLGNRDVHGSPWFGEFEPK